MLDAWCLILDAGCLVLDAGFWIWIRLVWRNISSGSAGTITPRCNHPAPITRIRHPASSIKYRVSSIQHPAPITRIRHPASSIEHPASSIHHPPSIPIFASCILSNNCPGSLPFILISRIFPHRRKHCMSRTAISSRWVVNACGRCYA